MYNFEGIGADFHINLTTSASSVQSFKRVDRRRIYCKFTRWGHLRREFLCKLERVGAFGAKLRIRFGVFCAGLHLNSTVSAPSAPIVCGCRVDLTVLAPWAPDFVKIQSCRRNRRRFLYKLQARRHCRRRTPSQQDRVGVLGAEFQFKFQRVGAFETETH